MIRRAAVAGRFYPGHPETLTRELSEYVRPATRRLRARGCLVPHAGYMYSGHVAGAVYGALDLPSTYIILCPNHSGLGAPLAMYMEGEWETPLGRAPVDRELASALRAACPSLAEDTLAHAAEHSLEVQLPFLQRLAPGFTFVPVAIGVGSFEPLAALGEALARVLPTFPRPVLIVASSDMNHYEDDHTTRAKDQKALAAILALDARGLYDVIRRQNISMCGFGPAVAMLTAACRLGADRATLVRYATSADAGGDRDAVVGYAGVAVYREQDQPQTSEC